MPTGDLAYWLGWLGVIALYVVMIYIAWKGLFGDKHRGTRRCPKCWHDLSHTPGMTCGECGYTAQSEAQLHRTRRRLGMATAAILICVIAAGVINERLSQRGFMGVLPTKALIWTLPLTVDDSGSATQELGRRMAADSLSNGEWLMILKRCAEGDAWRSPVDDQWEGTYGTLLDAWRGRFAAGVALANSAGSRQPIDDESILFQQQVRDILLSIPAKVEATTRPTWPVGAAPRVDLTLREWGPRGCAERMRLSAADDPDGEPRVVYAAQRARPHVPYSFRAAPVQPGQTSIELEVQVERREDPKVDEWTVIGRQRIELPIEVIEHAAMEPVHGERLDEAIQRTFGRGVVKWIDGPSPVRIRVGVQSTARPEFDDIAIGAIVEIRRNGVLARRLDLWWMAGVRDDLRYNFEIVYENLELLRALGTDEAEWTMTARGDHDVALRAGPADRYWAGEVELPFMYTEAQTSSPPRPWWTDEQLQEEQAGEYSKLQ